MKERLSPSIETGEALSLVRILAEHIEANQSDEWRTLADQCLERLIRREPVQYITGQTWFYDLKLNVNPFVLIPRPETEELVDWVVQDYRKGLIHSDPEILDVGTGSGCIALAIKKQIHSAHVEAIDVSPDALAVAMYNAVANEVMIEFRLYDILIEDLDRTFDIIVSNPPYVSQEELDNLSPEVRDYEPVIALAPETGGPLIFYERLVELGKTHLNTGGLIYMELSEFRASEIESLFIAAGYSTELRKDMQGKMRMLKAGESR